MAIPLYTILPHCASNTAGNSTIGATTATRLMFDVVVAMNLLATSKDKSAQTGGVLASPFMS